MRTCRHSCCIGGFLWLFTALLFLGLICQIALLVVVRFGVGVPLPVRPVENFVSHKLDHQYVVSIDRISINPDAVILAQGLQLRDPHHRSPILTVESLEIDLFAPGILIGSFVPESIRLQNLTLFEANTLFAYPRPIATIPSLHLVEDRAGWHLRDAFAKIANLELIGLGTLSLPSTSKGLPPPDWNQIHHQVTKAIDTVTAISSDFTEPVLVIEAQPRRHQGSELFWTLKSPDISLPGDFRLSQVVLQGSARLFDGPPRIQFSTTIEEIDHPDFNLDHVQLRSNLTLSAGRKRPTLHHLDLSILSIQAYGESVDGFIGRIEDPFSGRLRFACSASFRENPVILRGDLDSRSISGILAAEVDLDPHSLVGLVPGSEFIQEHLQVGRPLHLQLASYLRPGGIPDSIGFFLHASQPRLAGLVGQQVYGKGVLDRRKLHVERFHFDTRRYQLGGAFSLDFTNSDYRIILNGQFLPEEINQWFEPWWENLWSRFELTDLPNLDFYIRSNLLVDRDRELFGRLTLPPTRINQYPIDFADARVWGDERFLTIKINQATSGPNQASGYLHYFYAPEDDLLVGRAYDFSGTLAIPDDFQLAGDYVRNLLSSCQFEGPVSLRLSGNVIEEDAPASFKRFQHLTVVGETKHPARIAGLSLDSLALELKYANDIVDITPLEFRIAGGHGEGRIRWFPNRTDPLDLEIKLLGSNPRLLIESTAALRNNVAFEAGDSLGDPAGTVNLVSELRGDPADPFGFNGTLSLEVLSSDLGEVRFLGILSDLLSAAPPPFKIGSLSFNRLSSEIRLRDRELIFDKLALFSPSSRIEGTGTFAFANQSIQMKLRAFLFQETSFPLINFVAQIFNPITRILEFRLSGNIDDRNIRLDLNPVRIFDPNS
ncbi:MAG: AsmA-like C-terminal region-containing protein [Puniceicoccaceae bacterium]